MNSRGRVNSTVRWLSAQMTKLKTPIVIISIYLLMVIACILKAFDFAGSINMNWTLALVGMTLPWSLVSIYFAWALIHGAGLEFFTFMYLLFAGINSFIFFRVYSYFRRKAIK